MNRDLRHGDSRLLLSLRRLTPQSRTSFHSCNSWLPGDTLIVDADVKKGEMTFEPAKVKAAR
jgi:hypothetical protein